MCALHEDIIKEAEAKGEELKTFSTSPSIVTLKYCRDSGLIATDACNLDPRGNRVQEGYYTVDNMPTAFCDTHVEVKYCIDGEGIASEYCPAENLQTISLVRIIDRAFPKEVIVTDAEYAYRELTVGSIVSTKKTQPFFANELPEGVYAGVTTTVNTNQYNHYCTKHYSGQPYGLVIEEPVIPPIVALLPDNKLYIREAA
jgi:hypothetical protein